MLIQVERSKITFLNFQLKKLAKEEKIMQKKTMRIRVEIKELENRLIVRKVNKTKSDLLENVNKIVNL